MKNWLYFLIICTVLGCNEKVVEKPANLISRDQMAEILYDLAIINAAKKTNPSRLEERDLEAMPFIYNKHDIDSLQFFQSDVYYASIPEEYEAIYKTVEARLEREKSVFDQKKTREGDSIRKIAEEQRKKLKEQKIKKKAQDTLP